MSSSPSTELLPDAEESGSFGAANKSVAATTAQCGKRKRGPYYHNAKVRLKIAKYASENGNKSAVNEFSGELGHAVSEAPKLLRNFK